MRTCLIFCFAGLLIAADPPKKAAKATTATLSGCVDQRDGIYVLTGDKELKAIADLHGAGFSDDNFARYVGHRVKVEGTVAKEGEKTTVKVRNITSIADVCSPE